MVTLGTSTPTGPRTTIKSMMTSLKLSSAENSTIPDGILATWSSRMSKSLYKEVMHPSVSLGVNLKLVEPLEPLEMSVSISRGDAPWFFRPLTPPLSPLSSAYVFDGNGNTVCNISYLKIQHA